MLDPGSNATLIKKSTVSRLGLTVDKSKCLQSLRGITGQPLRVLGMTVQIGDQEKCKQYVSVVPDSYLNSEIA